MEDDSIDHQRETMEDYSRSTTENGEKVAPPSNGGGLINQLISTIIIPTEKGATESDEELTEKKKVVKEEDQGEQGKGGGGILENLILQMKSPRATSPEDVGFFQDPEEQQIQQTQNFQDPGDDGGGLMETIASRLPISIAENEGPTSDEASMLIHSVVHD